MEELVRKCKQVRRAIKEKGCTADNDVFVVVGKDNADYNPSGDLLITILAKVRKAAGIMRKSTLPNLVLVQNEQDVPNEVKSCVYWNHEALSTKSSLKVERFTRYFDDVGLLDPFVEVDGVLTNCYGPKQEFMKFDPTDHEKNHGAIQEALRSVLRVNSKRFSDFQLVIQCIIYSQYCESCLNYILQSMNSVENVQKFVGRVSRGLWCPRDVKSMQLTEWKDDINRDYKYCCWRLKPNAVLRAPKKPLVSPEQDSKPHTADWHSDTLHELLEVLQDNYDKLGEESDSERFEMVTKEQMKLNILKTNVIRWLMEMEQINFTSDQIVGKFGFNLGSKKLDDELESVVQKLFSDKSIQLNYASILEKIKPETYEVLKRKMSSENQVMTKIVEKTRSILEKTLKHASRARITVSSDESDSDEESDSGDSIVEIDKENRKVKKQEPMDRGLRKMTKKQKEAMVDAYKYAADCMQGGWKLPIVRRSGAFVFCLFCCGFVEDLGPACTCHEEEEVVVKAELEALGVGFKDVLVVDGEFFDKMWAALVKRQKFWKNAVKTHKNKSSEQQSSSSSAPSPDSLVERKKDPRMARRTGVPVQTPSDDKFDDKPEKTASKKRKAPRRRVATDSSSSPPSSDSGVAKKRPSDESSSASEDSLRPALPKRKPQKNPLPPKPGEYDDSTAYVTALNKKRMAKMVKAGYKIPRLGKDVPMPPPPPADKSQWKRSDYWAAAYGPFHQAMQLAKVPVVHLSDISSPTNSDVEDGALEMSTESSNPDSSGNDGGGGDSSGDDDVVVIDDEPMAKRAKHVETRVNSSHFSRPPSARIPMNGTGEGERLSAYHNNYYMNSNGVSSTNEIQYIPMGEELDRRRYSEEDDDEVTILHSPRPPTPMKRKQEQSPPIVWYDGPSTSMYDFGHESEVPVVTLSSAASSPGTTEECVPEEEPLRPSHLTNETDDVDVRLDEYYDMNANKTPSPTPSSDVGGIISRRACEGANTTLRVPSPLVSSTNDSHILSTFGARPISPTNPAVFNAPDARKSPSPTISFDFKQAANSLATGEVGSSSSSLEPIQRTVTPMVTVNDGIFENRDLQIARKSTSPTSTELEEPAHLENAKNDAPAATDIADTPASPDSNTTKAFDLQMTAIRQNSRPSTPIAEPNNEMVADVAFLEKDSDEKSISPDVLEDASYLLNSSDNNSFNFVPMGEDEEKDVLVSISDTKLSIRPKADLAPETSGNQKDDDDEITFMGITRANTHPAGRFAKSPKKEIEETKNDSPIYESTSVAVTTLVSEKAKQLETTQKTEEEKKEEIHENESYATPVLPDEPTTSAAVNDDHSDDESGCEFTGGNPRESSPEFCTTQ